jgi:glycosyltransferase involved in cell wall biosynthesis
MLTVLFETRNSENALAQSLSRLVSGSLAGVVLDVIIVDQGSTDQTRLVAEHAGCRFVDDGDLGQAIQKARGQWLLFLEPGARVEAGWVETAVDHMSASASPACFARSSAARLPFLQRLKWRSTGLANGLLISKRQATALHKKGKGADALARGLAMRTLKGTILPAVPMS